MIWVVFLMHSVPLDAVFHFDLNAAIPGWLLSAVQPKKQHPRHTWLYLCVKTCIFQVVIKQVPSQGHFCICNLRLGAWFMSLIKHNRLQPTSRKGNNRMKFLPGVLVDKTGSAHVPPIINQWITCSGQGHISLALRCASSPLCDALPTVDSALHNSSSV